MTFLLPGDSPEPLRHRASPPTLCILEALQMVCGSLHAGKHLREVTHPPSCKFVSFKGAVWPFPD